MHADIHIQSRKHTHADIHTYTHACKQTHSITHMQGTHTDTHAQSSANTNTQVLQAQPLWITNRLAKKQQRFNAETVSTTAINSTNTDKSTMCSENVQHACRRKRQKKPIHFNKAKATHIQNNTTATQSQPQTHNPTCSHLHTHTQTDKHADTFAHTCTDTKTHKQNLHKNLFQHAHIYTHRALIHKQLQKTYK